METSLYAKECAEMSCVQLLSLVELFVATQMQCTRLLCPPLSPGVCSSSCPLNQWCFLNISSSATPFSSCPQSFLASVFSNEWTLHITESKHWSFSFSISPSTEYSGLISFRIDWFYLLAVQGPLHESYPAPQFESINSLALSILYGPTLTSIHDYWKNHSTDCTDLCQQSDVKMSSQ